MTSLTSFAKENGDTNLHGSFCVYRKKIDQAGIKLEAAVVSKFEKLESRIDTLEREVRRQSAGKPRLPRSHPHRANFFLDALWRYLKVTIIGGY